MKRRIAPISDQLVAKSAAQAALRAGFQFMSLTGDRKERMNTTEVFKDV
jgi:hypothetical protein